MTGTGSAGILHPKDTRRFAVGGEPWMKHLLDQVICVDMGAEDLSTPEVTHRTGHIILWLEDDVTCHVMRTIRKWQQDPQTFTLDVTLLDGNEEWLEKYKFIGCVMTAVQHSMLNYAGGDYERVSLRVKPAWPLGTPDQDNLHDRVKVIDGTITNGNSSGKIMKLLQISFVVMTHEIRDEL